MCVVMGTGGVIKLEHGARFSTGFSPTLPNTILWVLASFILSSYFVFQSCQKLQEQQGQENFRATALAEARKRQVCQEDMQLVA